MAWALSSGDYARYFQALLRAHLSVPVGADTEEGGEPVTIVLDGRTCLPVFTSHEGLLATIEPLPAAIDTITFERLRDDWSSPQWWLAINPGLPIEACLPVELVDRGSRGELIPPYEQDVIIGRLDGTEWSPWPPGGANQALLDAVAHRDGAEYLDALRESWVTVPTTRSVSDREFDAIARVRLHHRGPGPVDDWTRGLLADFGVPAELIDEEFPWRLAASRSQPTAEVFTWPEFHARAYPGEPSVRMRFSTMLDLLPAGHAVSVNPGGPAEFALSPEDIPLLHRWEGGMPVPQPVLDGMRWALDLPGLREIAP